jgi:ABC-type Fe3+-hydroxamate transport system substrate-binding protein
MFRRLLASFVLVAAVAGCASKSETSSTTNATQAQTAGPFSVATQFSPDPPKQGPETITITVKDAGGNPVKGATVKIVTKMPTMSISGPT